MRSPNGMLGVTWGDDAAQAAARLGWACGDWQPWPGEGGYEECVSTTAPTVAFGHKAWGRLIRKGSSVEGIGFAFPGPDADVAAIREGVIAQLHLPPAASAARGLFHAWSDGSLVRLESDDGHSATLTVAGPRFGPAYQAWLLKQGFVKVGGSLRGH